VLDDLLKQVDVVADATPKKVAVANFEKYKAAGVKSIFQGGEKKQPDRSLVRGTGKLRNCH
jgi:glyceraldehyde-3-phosphate dehydrogenase (NAD(P))